MANADLIQHDLLCILRTQHTAHAGINQTCVNNQIALSLATCTTATAGIMSSIPVATWHTVLRQVAVQMQATR